MSGKYIALAALLPSCVIGNYGGKVSSGSPQRTIEGYPREVAVGGRYELEASGDTDLEIRVNARPLCRGARFGDRVVRQEYVRHKRFGLAAAETALGAVGMVVGFSLLMVGLGDSQTVDPATGALVLAPSLYFGYLGFSRVTASDTLSETDEVGRERNASEWRTEVHPCEDGQRIALVPRSLRIQVTFERGGGYYREVTTDASGVSTIPGFMAGVATVAAECGTAMITVSDERQDAVVSESTDAGEPGDVHPFAIAALDAQVSVGGRRAMKLAELPETERTLADQCHQTVAAACAAKIDDELQSGCEDSCARKVDATRCVLANRQCHDEADDASTCDAELASCLRYVGVEPADLAACANRCAANVRQEECE